MPGPAEFGEFTKSTFQPGSKSEFDFRNANPNFQQPLQQQPVAPIVQGPGTLEQSALDAIAQQEGQLAEIEGITAPFRQAGLDIALPQLSALAFGGDVDFQPSQLFNRQLESGRTGILRGQAARGGVKSSGTFERLGDLVSGLTGEDIGRFQRGQSSLLQSGLRAEDLVRQAGTGFAQSAGNIFGNLGQGLNVAAQQRGNLAGQQALSKSQTLAGGISGLGSLLSELF